MTAQRLTPGPVTVTFFRGISPHAVAVEHMTWDTFAASLPDALAVERPDKIELPSLSCCEFAGGYRSTATAGDHTALVLDVDAAGDPVALLEACAALCCVVYESPSSTDDAPRFRVIAALPAPYPAHAVPAARAALASALGLDPQASGVSSAAASAQMYFAGRISGTRARCHWRFDGQVWTPPAPGDAPDLHDVAFNEPSAPAYGPEKVPDLSCLTPEIEPDPADPLGMRRGGRDISRALGGYLARKGYHPDAIAEAVWRHVPSSRPQERAEQARETAEQWYAGDPRAAGYSTLSGRFRSETMAALEQAVADPWCEALAARWSARLSAAYADPIEVSPAQTEAAGEAPAGAERVTAEDVLRVLPSWVQTHVLAVREEIRTPLDLNVANAIGVLASAVQGRVKVRIHQNYTAHTCLFVCAVADSAQVKSKAFSLASAPIRDWVREKQETGAEALERARTERADWALRLKALEKEREKYWARGEDPDEPTELLQLRLRLAQPEPVGFEFLVEDVTPEALADLLAQHGRIACFSSDASKVFQVVSGRYSNGQADLGAWLEAYDGTSRKVHRVGRKVETPRHDATTLSAVLSIQPQVLETITGNAAMVGEGFVQRFCWVVCERAGVRWAPGEDVTPIPVDVSETYAAGVRTLLDLPSGTEARLSPNAYVAYKAFRDELEWRMKGKGADLGDDMLSWAGKHLERTTRIAAILWAADGAKGEISSEQMARAILIGRWLIPHAVRALRGADADTTEARLVELVRRLQEKRGGPVPRRDVQRGAPRALRGDSKALGLRLDNLVERGLLIMSGKSSYGVP